MSVSKKKSNVNSVDNLILGKLNGSIKEIKPKIDEIIDIVEDPILNEIGEEDKMLMEQLKMTPKKKISKTGDIEPKKRGRKPKEKVYGISGKVNDGVDMESENVIIHLPIQSKDIENEIIEGTEEIKGIEPEGFDGEINYAEAEAGIIEKDGIMISHMDDWFNSGDMITNIKHETEYDKVLRKIKEKREDEVENYSKTFRTTVEKCMIPMDEANKSMNWPSNSTICCWWCCHTFEGIPCALPVEMMGSKLKVFGNFCTPECAAAYNFNENKIPGEKWERYSLLNYLYKDIYTSKIRLAPSRMTLKMFGGHLSIKEFRNISSVEDKHYNIVLPPIISIIPVQELGNLDKGYSSKNEKKHLMNSTETDAEIGLRLKRSKPFQYTEHTLEKVMGNIVISN